jgi:hypothetical protein
MTFSPTDAYWKLKTPVGERAARFKVVLSPKEQSHANALTAPRP